MLPVLSTAWRRLLGTVLPFALLFALLLALFFALLPALWLATRLTLWLAFPLGLLLGFLLVCHPICMLFWSPAWRLTRLSRRLRGLIRVPRLALRRPRLLVLCLAGMLLSLPALTAGLL